MSALDRQQALSNKVSYSHQPERFPPSYAHARPAWLRALKERSSLARFVVRLPCRKRNESDRNVPIIAPSPITLCILIGSDVHQN